MDIRHEDLIHKCTACGGDGIISPPVEPGKEPEIEMGAVCDRCGGKGIMLTDSGMAIKALVLMIQDGKI